MPKTPMGPITIAADRAIAAFVSCISQLARLRSRRPDAVRLVLRDALAEVYAGADLADVDALLDQMTDRDLTVADLAVHVCPPCPHIQTSDEGTSYCDLAEHAIAYHRDEAARLREALDAALAFRSEHLPTGGE